MMRYWFSRRGNAKLTFLDDLFQRRMIAKQFGLAEEFFGHGTSGGKLLQDDLQSLVRDIRNGFENTCVNLDRLLYKGCVGFAMPFLNDLLDKSAILFDQPACFDVRSEKALYRCGILLNKRASGGDAGRRINKIRH